MKKRLILAVSAGIFCAALILAISVETLTVKNEAPAYHPISSNSFLPVESKEEKNEEEPEKTLTVYLTFDDGPYQYTEKLLESLDELGVKATFFVTDQNPQYRKLIRSEAERGHSVGIHTASHIYRRIYRGDEEFRKDFSDMQSVITRFMGKPATIYRFPGGSSNTVSSTYCEGIVSRMAEELTEKGYVLFDWDIDAGDCEPELTAQDVFENVTGQLADFEGEHAVVLMHDIYEWTVDAVPMIVSWGKEHGCTFAALAASSPPCRLEIQN